MSNLNARRSELRDGLKDDRRKVPGVLDILGAHNYTDLFSRAQIIWSHPVGYDREALYMAYLLRLGELHELSGWAKMDKEDFRVSQSSQKREMADDINRYGTSAWL